MITLDPEGIQEWADAHQVSGSADDLTSAAEVRELIEGYVAQANQKLERWETIKKFELLPNELSIDEGEITPSQKIRRKAVEQKYADLLNGMYEKD